ncbi:MoaD/ThiS family protein [Actinoalloteichus spitiensis]|uniref:MoaD/ThiS family protein n=1 Tax=Actinoalloteichus spitiensis TaxID=252394 RepID=UPI0003813C47|nr:MoaD/ThiS family protein [Actinoalloteichus spitiensis]
MSHETSPPEGGNHIVVRYFAGAGAAAGTGQESLPLPDGEPTVAAVLAMVSARHGERLDRVLRGCSFLLDGVAVRDRNTPITAGSELDVLPPFAGG